MMTKGDDTIIKQNQETKLENEGGNKLKTKILAIFLAISLILAVPATALAGNTITITMTTGEVLGVSVSPDSWAIGTSVAANTAYETGEANFTATNTGNVNEDFQIAGAETGGAGTAWVLSELLTNSATAYALGYKTIAGSYPTNYTAITKTVTNFATNIAANGGTQTFGLGLLTPTTIIGGEAKTATVTITCVKS
jgi:hypothetical protein